MEQNNGVELCLIVTPTDVPLFKHYNYLLILLSQIFAMYLTVWLHDHFLVFLSLWEHGNHLPLKLAIIESSRLSFVHVLVAVRDCQVDSITNRAMPCRLSSVDVGQQCRSTMSINDVDQRCRSTMSIIDVDHRCRSSINDVDHRCRASISSIEHNSGMVLSLINYGWYRPSHKSVNEEFENLMEFH